MAALADEALEQRMNALQRANEVRGKCSALKRDVTARDQRAETVVAHPPEYALNMKVHDLLLATPKLGNGKVNTIMVALKIPPGQTLGGLDKLQRQKLVAHLSYLAGRTSVTPRSREAVTDPGFAVRLKEARIAAGLRQSDVASAINYAHHVSLSHWENGYRIPRPPVIERLAEVLGVDAAWLGGWS